MKAWFWIQKVFVSLFSINVNFSTSEKYSIHLQLSHTHFREIMSFHQDKKKAFHWEIWANSSSSAILNNLIKNKIQKDYLTYYLSKHLWSTHLRCTKSMSLIKKANILLVIVVCEVRTFDLFNHFFFHCIMFDKHLCK